jgi:hypothetical protein
MMEPICSSETSVLTKAKPQISQGIFHCADVVRLCWQLTVSTKPLLLSVRRMIPFLTTLWVLHATLPVPIVISVRIVYMWNLSRMRIYFYAWFYWRPNIASCYCNNVRVLQQLPSALEAVKSADWGHLGWSPVCALQTVPGTMEPFSVNIVFQKFTIICWVISFPFESYRFNDGLAWRHTPVSLSILLRRILRF